MTYCFIDSETMGLGLMEHDIWELAWALNDDTVKSGFVDHDPDLFEPDALKVNKYMERYDGTVDGSVEHDLADIMHDFKDRGQKVTLVGANPSFDAYRLSRRWDWAEPWHYRMIDLSTYAMPYFHADYPMGLLEIRNRLASKGFEVPSPDHTAAGDVETLRAAFYVLKDEYEEAQLSRG